MTRFRAYRLFAGEYDVTGRNDDRVIRLPQGPSPRDAATIGGAGFTAR